MRSQYARFLSVPLAIIFLLILAAPESSARPALRSLPEYSAAAQSTSAFSSTVYLPLVVKPPTWLAFTSTRDAGTLEIYRIAEDGTSPTRLTFNDVADSAPEWSPDNKEIAFQSYRSYLGNYYPEIYVMNPDETGEVQLTTQSGSLEPTWSPDGTKIAFASIRNNGNFDIWVMNADGSAQTQVTNTPLNEGSPAWSPDGTKIAYNLATVSPYDSNELYMMNADGSGQTPLYSSSWPCGNNYRPAWSPDGTKIAYWCAGQIYVMTTDGSTNVNLTAGYDPTWSPDGAKIAYWLSPDDDSTEEIYTINIDGSEKTRLTYFSAFSLDPAWAR
jgi:Tol biopolymer transport system component